MTPGLWLLLHGPPRWGKSMFASIRLVAWCLGCKPDMQIGVASYNETHSEEFSQVIIDLMESEAHLRYFPAIASRLVSARQPRKQWQVNARRRAMDGSYSFVALGLNSGAAGKGFDLLIIDDPYANYQDSISEATNAQLQQWWTNTIKPRLKADATVIFMFHRWHDNDFIGWIQKQEKNRWKMVRFPAVADDNADGADPTGRAPGEILSPIRDQAFIDEVKKDEMTFSALFQGRPLNESKKMFMKAWFYPDHVIALDQFPDEIQWVRFWDLAASTKETADFTVGALCGVWRDKIFIRDIIRVKEEWPEVRKLIVKTARSDPQGTMTGVEQVQMQLAMVQELARHPVFMSHSYLSGVPVRGDKKQRAAVWSTLSRRGKVYLAEADWNEAFFDEAVDFDGLGLTHDDQIDAVSGAMSLLATMREDEEIEEHEYGTEEYWKQLHKQRLAFIERNSEEAGVTEDDRIAAARYRRANRDEHPADEFDGVLRL